LVRGKVDSVKTQQIIPGGESRLRGKTGENLKGGKGSRCLEVVF